MSQYSFSNNIVCFVDLNVMSWKTKSIIKDGEKLYYVELLIVVLEQLHLRIISWLLVPSRSGFGSCPRGTKICMLQMLAVMLTAWQSLCPKSLYIELHENVWTDIDEAFVALVEELDQNKSGMWNSAELFEFYQSHGGHRVLRQQLIQQVSDYFGGDLLVLSSQGISSIIMFHE